MPVFRIYVEKKPEFAVEAQSVMSDVKTALRLDLTNLRILNRYDADKLSREDFSAAVNTVFSEPAVDVVYDELPALEEGDRIFAVEYLPGSSIREPTVASSVSRSSVRARDAASRMRAFISFQVHSLTRTLTSSSHISSTPLKAARLHSIP